MIEAFFPNQPEIQNTPFPETGTVLKINWVTIILNAVVVTAVGLAIYDKFQRDGEGE